MNNTLTIERNKVITMQYSLTNAEGVVLRDAASKPVSYLHGAGTIPARLEQELAAHKIGDIVQARLLPDDAFGKRDVELICEVPLSEIPAAEQIEVGGHVVGMNAEGKEITFAVTAINNEIASLDGNHPLAGQTLIFEVEIQAIRDATNEELAAGKAEDPQADS
jgi:FKBP-type peptidyl-prolyl cis-trans isomerase SlyD